jgi:(1->4)-alpha-D-glucan 1-alpha-D-glucosylmutase
VRSLLDPNASKDFLRDIGDFVARIAPAAALNSLVQCVLRCTAPGVPDLFQGAEFWDFSLVDPDNRRPVDFPARAVALGQDSETAAALARWSNGELKQSVIARLLAVRASREECFRVGAYRPARLEGVRSEHVVGFERTYSTASILVVLPRLCARACLEAATPQVPPSFWENTVLIATESRSWRPVFGGTPKDFGTILCAELFQNFPLAVLVAD